MNSSSDVDPASNLRNQRGKLDGRIAPTFADDPQGSSFSTFSSQRDSALRTVPRSAPSESASEIHQDPLIYTRPLHTRDWVEFLTGDKPQPALLPVFCEKSMMWNEAGHQLDKARRRDIRAKCEEGFDPFLIADQLDSGDYDGPNFFETQENVTGRKVKVVASPPPPHHDITTPIMTMPLPAATPPPMYEKPTVKRVKTGMNAYVSKYSPQTPSGGPSWVSPSPKMKYLDARMRRNILAGYREKNLDYVEVSTGGLPPKGKGSGEKEETWMKYAKLGKLFRTPVSKQAEQNEEAEGKESVRNGKKSPEPLLSDRKAPAYSVNAVPVYQVKVLGGRKRLVNAETTKKHGKKSSREKEDEQVPVAVSPQRSDLGAWSPRDEIKIGGSDGQKNDGRILSEDVKKRAKDVGAREVRNGDDQFKTEVKGDSSANFRVQKGSEKSVKTREKEKDQTANDDTGEYNLDSVSTCGRSEDGSGNPNMKPKEPMSGKKSFLSTSSARDEAVTDGKGNGTGLSEGSARATVEHGMADDATTRMGERVEKQVDFSQNNEDKTGKTKEVGDHEKEDVKALGERGETLTKPESGDEAGGIKQVSTGNPESGPDGDLSNRSARSGGNDANGEPKLDDVLQVTTEKIVSGNRKQSKDASSPRAKENLAVSERKSAPDSENKENTVNSEENKSEQQGKTNDKEGNVDGANPNDGLKKDSTGAVVKEKAMEPGEQKGQTACEDKNDGVKLKIDEVLQKGDKGVASPADSGDSDSDDVKAFALAEVNVHRKEKGNKSVSVANEDEDLSGNESKAKAVDGEDEGANVKERAQKGNTKSDAEAKHSERPAIQNDDVLLEQSQTSKQDVGKESVGEMSNFKESENKKEEGEKVAPKGSEKKSPEGEEGQSEANGNQPSNDATQEKQLDKDKDEKRPTTGEKSKTKGEENKSGSDECPKGDSKLQTDSGKEKKDLTNKSESAENEKSGRSSQDRKSTPADSSSTDKKGAEKLDDVLKNVAIVSREGEPSEESLSSKGDEADEEVKELAEKPCSKKQCEGSSSEIGEDGGKEGNDNGDPSSEGKSKSERKGRLGSAQSKTGFGSDRAAPSEQKETEKGRDRHESEGSSEKAKMSSKRGLGSDDGAKENEHSRSDCESEKQNQSSGVGSKSESGVGSRDSASGLKKGTKDDSGEKRIGSDSGHDHQKSDDGSGSAVGKERNESNPGSVRNEDDSGKISSEGNKKETESCDVACGKKESLSASGSEKKLKGASGSGSSRCLSQEEGNAPDHGDGSKNDSESLSKCDKKSLSVCDDDERSRKRDEVGGSGHDGKGRDRSGSNSSSEGNSSKKREPRQVNDGDSHGDDKPAGEDEAVKGRSASKSSGNLMKEGDAEASVEDESKRASESGPTADKKKSVSISEPEGSEKGEISRSGSDGRISGKTGSGSGSGRGSSRRGKRREEEAGSSEGVSLGADPADLSESGTDKKAQGRSGSGSSCSLPKDKDDEGLNSRNYTGEKEKSVSSSEPDGGEKGDVSKSGSDGKVNDKTESGHDSRGVSQEKEKSEAVSEPGGREQKNMSENISEKGAKDNSGSHSSQSSLEAERSADTDLKEDSPHATNSDKKTTETSDVAREMKEDLSQKGNKDDSGEKKIGSDSGHDHQKSDDGSGSAVGRERNESNPGSVRNEDDSRKASSEGNKKETESCDVACGKKESLSASGSEKKLKGASGSGSSRCLSQEEGNAPDHGDGSKNDSESLSKCDKKSLSVCDDDERSRKRDEVSGSGHDGKGRDRSGSNSSSEGNSSKKREPRQVSGGDFHEDEKNVGQDGKVCEQDRSEAGHSPKRENPEMKDDGSNLGSVSDRKAESASERGCGIPDGDTTGADNDANDIVAVSAQAEDAGKGSGTAGTVDGDAEPSSARALDANNESDPKKATTDGSNKEKDDKLPERAMNEHREPGIDEKQDSGSESLEQHHKTQGDDACEKKQSENGPEKKDDSDEGALKGKSGSDATRALTEGIKDGEPNDADSKQVEGERKGEISQSDSERKLNGKASSDSSSGRSLEGHHSASGKNDRSSETNLSTDGDVVHESQQKFLSEEKKSAAESGSPESLVTEKREDEPLDDSKPEAKSVEESESCAREMKAGMDDRPLSGEAGASEHVEKSGSDKKDVSLSGKESNDGKAASSESSSEKKLKGKSGSGSAKSLPKEEKNGAENPDGAKDESEDKNKSFDGDEESRKREGQSRSGHDNKVGSESSSSGKRETRQVNGGDSHGDDKNDSVGEDDVVARRLASNSSGTLTKEGNGQGPVEDGPEHSSESGSKKPSVSISEPNLEKKGISASGSETKVSGSGSGRSSSRRRRRREEGASRSDVDSLSAAPSDLSESGADKKSQGRSGSGSSRSLPKDKDDEARNVTSEKVAISEGDISKSGSDRKLSGKTGCSSGRGSSRKRRHRKAQGSTSDADSLSAVTDELSESGSGKKKSVCDSRESDETLERNSTDEGKDAPHNDSLSANDDPSDSNSEKKGKLSSDSLQISSKDETAGEDENDMKKLKSESSEGKNSSGQGSSRKRRHSETKESASGGDSLSPVNDLSESGSEKKLKTASDSHENDASNNDSLSPNHDDTSDSNIETKEDEPNSKLSSPSTSQLRSQSESHSRHLVDKMEQTEEALPILETQSESKQTQTDNENSPIANSILLGSGSPSARASVATSCEMFPNAEVQTEPTTPKLIIARPRASSQKRSPEERQTKFADSPPNTSPSGRCADGSASGESSSRRKQVVLDLSDAGSSGRPSSRSIGRPMMDAPPPPKYPRIDRGVEVDMIKEDSDFACEDSSRRDRNLRMSRNRRGLTRSCVYNAPSLFAPNNSECEQFPGPEPLNIDGVNGFDDDGEASMLVPGTAPGRRRPPLPRYAKTVHSTPMTSSRLGGYHTSRFTSRSRKPLGRYATSFTSDADDFRDDRSVKSDKFSLVCDPMVLRAKFLSSPREESLESLPPLDFNERDSVLIAQSEALADAQMRPMAFSSLVNLAHIDQMVGKPGTSVPSSSRTTRTRSRQGEKYHESKSSSVRFM